MIKKILSASLIVSSTFTFANEKFKEDNTSIIKERIKTIQIEKSLLDVKTPDSIKHSFDIDKPKDFFTVLRFIDMHVESGVDPDDIDVAVVVHGGIVTELGKETKNKHLEMLLNSDMVTLYVCGQSIYNKGLDKSFLNPKINLALSAMTAHHLLQKRGYTYNPF